MRGQSVTHLRIRPAEEGGIENLVADNFRGRVTMNKVG
jgi:hypothetical protein